jgi:hypothetical protein
VTDKDLITFPAFSAAGGDRQHSQGMAPQFRRAPCTDSHDKKIVWPLRSGQIRLLPSQAPDWQQTADRVWPCRDRLRGTVLRVLLRAWAAEGGNQQKQHDNEVVFRLFGRGVSPAESPTKRGVGAHLLYASAQVAGAKPELKQIRPHSVDFTTR